MVWDNEHHNPLHQAAASDMGTAILHEIISLVEQRGGEMEGLTLTDVINNQDSKGQTVLHIGVDLGQHDICRLALSK